MPLTRHFLFVEFFVVLKKVQFYKKPMNKGCFKKGNIPWNKDLKGFNPSPKTQFKADATNTGETHKSWKGGVQKNKNDCAYLWSDTNKRVRRPKKIYEDAYGEMPKGFVIYHIDGNKDNDELMNLEAISRKELLFRNQQTKNQTR